jgi:hypothetical protein
MGMDVADMSRRKASVERAVVAAFLLEPTRSLLLLSSLQVSYKPILILTGPCFRILTKLQKFSRARVGIAFPISQLISVPICLAKLDSTVQSCCRFAINLAPIWVFWSMSA